jgi:hypothetical protein
MKAYFCTVTGRRIAAAGVCKEVDPTNGQDEVSLNERGQLEKLQSTPLADAEVHNAIAAEVKREAQNEINAAKSGAQPTQKPDEGKKSKKG